MKRIGKNLMRRLISAFTYAQRKTKTSYHFTFSGATRSEMAEISGSENSIMAIDESARGDDDENHFVISVNVQAVAERSMANLRKDAGHEVIHAILHKLYKRSSMKNLENTTYVLQRAFFGEDSV